MPTILLQNGFRFFFYSRENNEPIHIHVSKAEAEGKIWLEPSLQVAYFLRFGTSEQKEIIDIITANYEHFKQQWNDYFNK